jgi:hypothetical protein
MGTAPIFLAWQTLDVADGATAIALSFRYAAAACREDFQRFEGYDLLAPVPNG